MVPFLVVTWSSQEGFVLAACEENGVSAIRSNRVKTEKRTDDFGQVNDFIVFFLASNFVRDSNVFIIPYRIE